MTEADILGALREVVDPEVVALSRWLARYDIARRTIHQPGVTRFIAVCLLSGYFWLAVAGVLAIATGAAPPGQLYDAVLHAIFLGFVVTMIFGHAPIVFPAAIGKLLPFRSAFYVHLTVLRASVALRLTGDLVDAIGRWGRGSVERVRASGIRGQFRVINHARVASSGGRRPVTSRRSLRRVTVTARLLEFFCRGTAWSFEPLEFGFGPCGPPMRFAANPGSCSA